MCDDKCEISKMYKNTSKMVKIHNDDNIILRLWLFRGEALHMCKKPIDNQELHSDLIPCLDLITAQAITLIRDMLVREAGEQFSQVAMRSDSITVLQCIGDCERLFRIFEKYPINCDFSTFFVVLRMFFIFMLLDYQHSQKWANSY